jgi:hypothetical protein
MREAGTHLGFSPLLSHYLGTHTTSTCWLLIILPHCVDRVVLVVVGAIISRAPLRISLLLVVVVVVVAVGEDAGGGHGGGGGCCW